MSLQEKIKDLKIYWFIFGIMFGLFFGFFLAVGLVILGLGVIFYAMFKPLTDEDFSDEELRIMGKTPITKIIKGNGEI